MSIIEDFIDQYQNKISYYEKVRAYAENLVGNTLRDSGIMAITSSRVKDATRLKEKLLLRQKDTNYASFSDIENDIVDFIGVRIALYFPNDQKKVESIIHQLFEVEKQKYFRMSNGKVIFTPDGFLGIVRLIIEYLSKEIKARNFYNKRFVLRYKLHLC